MSSVRGTRHERIQRRGLSTVIEKRQQHPCCRQERPRAANGSARPPWLEPTRTRVRNGDIHRSNQLAAKELRRAAAKEREREGRAKGGRGERTVEHEHSHQGREMEYSFFTEANTF